MEEQESPYFENDESLLTDWKKHFKQETGLDIRVGRWKIPGKPLTVLVNFYPLFEKKNEIYAKVWEDYGVDSLHAYGDYDESSMFGYATGLVMENYYRFHKLSKKQSCSAFQRMDDTGAFHIQKTFLKLQPSLPPTLHQSVVLSPEITNHYDYLTEYNGDQMAFELNMVSKHSTEKKLLILWTVLLP